MATIGSFKKSGNELQGEIVTLSVQVKGVRIVPEEVRSNEGRDYLSVKLDDPSFTAPIYASLFDDEDGESSTLIWSRPNRQRNGD